MPSHTLTSDQPSIVAFEKALNDHEASYVVAAPDWAPTPPARRKRRSVDSNYGTGYFLLRYPLLFVILIWSMIILFIYSMVRLYVSINEWLFLWRGDRRKLRLALRNAKSYSEWIDAAAKLDAFLGYDVWREDPRSVNYDYRSVHKSLLQLKVLCDRLSYDNTIETAELLATVLETCIKYNFAGIHNTAAYSQCYSGTKKVIDEFIEVSCTAIDLLAKTPLPKETIASILRSLQTRLGRSALCLSGGGSFSYRHFGVIKALLDVDLLPDIVSGTSGGGLVAAFVCTRSNDELRATLTPDLAHHITACWESFPQWLVRLYKTGARFDAVDWAVRVQYFTNGDLTFKEAYVRTGRVLNITAVPADPKSPVMLCNHLTCPDTLIWSAVLASAAVPGIIRPVTLMMKSPQGHFVPWNFGSKWSDGSLRTDIPTQALNTFFNVNFSVVSQVNPHIKLFAYLPRGQVGRPVTNQFSRSRWRGGFVLAASEVFLKLEIRKCAKLCRNLDLIPKFMNQDWSNVFLQQFQGTVTVWPRIWLMDFWRILADPSVEELKHIMQVGESAMYPKLAMIRDFRRIETTIAMNIEATREAASEATSST